MQKKSISATEESGRIRHEKITDIVLSEDVIIAFFLEDISG